MKRMIMTSVAVLAISALTAAADAGQRHGGGGAGGHAVARPGEAIAIGHAVPRVGGLVRGPIVGTSRSYRHYRYYSYPYARRGLGFYFGYHGGYGWGYPWYAYRYYGYPYAHYGYPYAFYGFGSGYAGPIAVAPAQGSGRLRIQNAPRDAQLFVDGYYVGIVDSTGGASSGLDLEAGVHRIEIRAAGFGTITFDVSLRAGQTITYRASMPPFQPQP